MGDSCIMTKGIEKFKNVSSHMSFKITLGQERLKQQLNASIDKNQVPHCQAFIDSGGRGGLSLALDFLLELVPSPGVGQHPDHHFLYPVATTAVVKSKPRCGDFSQEWRTFLKDHPYGNVNDWLRHMGADNKQGNITVDDVEELVRSVSYSAYSGGNKVCVLWGLERLKDEAGNKLLKLIEEPPKNTYFLMVVPDESHLLATLRSRSQIIHLPPLSEEVIFEKLLSLGHSKDDAAYAARLADGDLRKALSGIQNQEELAQQEKILIHFLRTAFRAKKNTPIVLDLMEWSNAMGSATRNEQKAFIVYSLDFMRQAMLVSYSSKNLVRFRSQNNFSLEKFAPYLHHKNLLPIVQLLEDTRMHIERNANGKILFADFALQMTRLLNS